MDPVTAYEHIAEIKKAALLASEPSDELDDTDTIIAAIGMRGALDNIIKLCRQYEKMIGKETNDARAIG